MPSVPETGRGQDPVLATLFERHDLASLGGYDEYERLVVSINNQSVSTAAATTVREQVENAFDGSLDLQTVLETDESALTDAGLGTQKSEYVRDAAIAFQDRDLIRSDLSERTDESEIGELTSSRGIGEWTTTIYPPRTSNAIKTLSVSSPPV